jgi:hypothetical protein
VERAREHIRQLEFELGTFLKGNPYEVGTKRDPATRRLIYYVIGVEEVPERISLIAADVLQNLSSALDHLAYALLLVGTGGQPGNQAKRVFFPIEDDATKYAAESPRKLKGMSPNAITAIDGLKPYKGGNDQLWQMNQLNRIGKHRFIVMAGSEFRSIDLGGHMFRNMLKSMTDPEMKAGLEKMDIQAFFRSSETGFPLQKGYELFSDLPDAEVDNALQFRFQVAFKEPGVIEGGALVETLQNMVQTVDKILNDLAPFLT